LPPLFPGIISEVIIFMRIFAGDRGGSGVFLAAMLVFCAFLPSCAEKSSMEVVASYPIPLEYSFAAPLGDVWKGTVRAISEEERIQVLDEESGLLVTEYRSINTLVQFLEDKPLLGKVYKNGYTVTVQADGLGATRVSVRSRLLVENFLGTESPLEDASLSAYMRQELFRKICFNLLPDPHQCPTLFPDYHRLSVSCTTPASTSFPLDTSPSSGAADRQGNSKKVTVKELQQALAKAGYQPGPVDGRMGPKTRGALQRFQQAKGITGTGDIDWETLQLLGF